MRLLAVPIFLALFAWGGAQAQPSPRPAPPNRSEAEARAYLSVVRTLMSQCENSAWTLWHSNSYDDWRRQKSRSLTMNYSSQSYPRLPDAPALFSADLASALKTQVEKANTTVATAHADFKSLATYINAKDFEDDKFRKGDDINLRLLEAGKTCYGMQQATLPLYARANEALAARAEGEKTPLQKAIAEDYALALKLDSALAKGPDARAEIAPLVEDASRRLEERQALLTSDATKDASAPRSFYHALNEWVAVPLRRLLRDGKTDSKLWKAAFAERPRTTVAVARDAILKIMSEDYAKAITAR